MLQYIRNKNVVYTIIGIVILAFLGLIYFSWGKGGGGAAPDEIARINGKSIFLQDIKNIYENLKEKYKDQITEENTRQIEKQILNESVQAIAQKIILLEQAKKAKVSVSDDEILRSISRMKMFKTEDGKPNMSLFLRLPSFYKQKLEKETKEDLTTQLLWIRLFDLIKISDVDLQIFFQEKYTQSKIRFVIIEFKEGSQGQIDNLLNVNPERVQAEKTMDKFIRLVKKNRNFIGTASALGLRVKTTDYFSFFHPIKKPGSDERYNEIEFRDIYVNAFKLSPNQISDKISLNKGIAVIQVISRKNPDMNKFYKELPVLRAEYESKIRNVVQNEWYMHVAGKANYRLFIDEYLNKRFQEN